MPVFMVVQDEIEPVTGLLPARMAQAVQSGQAFQIAPNAWAFDYDGTSRAVAEHLGIREGGNASGVVVSVSGYSGFTSRYLWEWFASRPSAKSE